MENYGNYANFKVLSLGHHYNLSLDWSTSIYIDFVPDEIRLINLSEVTPGGGVAPVEDLLRINTDLVEGGMLTNFLYGLNERTISIPFKNKKNISGTYFFNITQYDGTAVSNAALCDFYLSFNLLFIKY